MPDQTNLPQPLSFEQLVIDALEVDLRVCEDRLVTAVQKRDAYRLLVSESLTQLAKLTEAARRQTEQLRALRAELRSIRSGVAA